MFSFVTMLARIHEHLSEHGKIRLAGEIRKGLEKEFGLNPLAFEIRTATHLMIRGFDVQFHDLENQGRYDFLAEKDGIKCEVECKHISADMGRKIHRRHLYELSTALSPLLSQAADYNDGGLHLRVEIPDRLTGNKHEHHALCSHISTALLGSQGFATDECSIAVERFDAKKSDLGDEHIADFCRQLGIESHHSILCYKPGKATIVVSFKSCKDDKVLSRILERLKDDAKHQFSMDLPAILYIHLSDLSDTQLLSIASEEKAGNVTGIRATISKLINDRPHLHTVALTTDGPIYSERRDAGAFFRTSTQEKGISYSFSNEKHAAFSSVLSGIFA